MTQHAARQPGQWRRRNRWGLIALVPALLLACGYQTYDLHRRIEERTPGRPISAATPGGWVEYRGHRIRLAGLVKIPAPVGYDRRPIVLPDGVTAWRARLEFEVIGTRSEENNLISCDIAAVDGRGRSFGTLPVELKRLYSSGSIYCSGDSTKDPSRFVVDPVFVVSGGERPVAIRLSWRQDLPRYLELAPG